MEKTQETVQRILLEPYKYLLQLPDPNGDSPANVNISKGWREDRNGEFKGKVAHCLRKSQETAE
ncbi:PREDICTED: ubiquitin-conjugating enzyme E2 G1-like isoform X1 [Galeopterus variegatus]|uniref:Ubiquitin-conjugating enzyme E2 G1-like isoform X1 n=1 Tax=Galeopterus variegatus TaxID=482537 RepID=A0ABM0RFK2_GALVR|nr:PREDICTED: ubiquitin-conjugating enzyme E2 G1-like isoform X1 [Galeopterus variegatus]